MHSPLSFETLNHVGKVGATRVLIYLPLETIVYLHIIYAHIFTYM